MTSELLPCPFCGGLAALLEGTIYESRDRVECSTCPATVEGGDPAKAIAAWNTRAKADQIVGVEGAEITEAVHAWVREDLPLGAQMTAGLHIQKLVARLQALKGPAHD